MHVCLCRLEHDGAAVSDMLHSRQKGTWTSVNSFRTCLPNRASVRRTTLEDVEDRDAILSCSEIQRAFF